MRRSVLLLALAITITAAVTACTEGRPAALTAATPATLPTRGPAVATTTWPDEESAGPGPRGVAIHRPDDPVGAPVVVLVHGGGWLGGEPLALDPLARGLSEAGALVFNTSYRTARGEGGFPASFDDIACAIRYARAAAAELGASESLTLAGHSAGAHLAAVVALSDESTFGADCEWKGEARPDRFVGLAGIYQIDAVEVIMQAFLGGTRAEIPETWEAADPFVLLDRAEGMEIVLVHGTADRVVPAAASELLAGALDEIGADVTLELVPGADHADVRDPDVTVDLILP